MTSQGDERFTNVLDLAIRFGKILIVQDVDTIDPILFPILRNDYIVQGVRKLVRLGDKLVDWNDNFRLFLFSRSAGLAPTASPQANALVNIINFNTTEAGLSEQLVALTVKYENPELEQRKKQLLEQEEQLKLQLAQLEEKLLQTLGNSQGNILENTDVLSSLRQLKQSSATIGQSLKESLELQSSLEKERSTYNELAQFGSRLFFAIRELAKLNPCYQFSVPAFMQIFLKNLDSQNIENGPEKLDFIRQRLLKTVYTMVSRALFKPDKIVAAIHIVREMYPNLFQPNEWELFVGLKTSRPSSNQIQIPGWIDESRSPNVSAIKALLPSVFSVLHLEDAALWTKSSTAIPSVIGQVLSPFQQVLVVQAIYPDKLINILAHFITRTLELTELFPATPNLRIILNETSSSEPILVLLPSDGSGAYDMTAELNELAKETLGENSLIEIAMGTDETEKATESVMQAARSGQWVCLKNVHLVSSWLPALDRMMNELQHEVDGGFHANFRLWMTAEPVSSLPVSLLQRCKKIVSEAPQGMKRNLNRTFEAWNHNNMPTSPIHMQALFVLAWFHAVVQERRNYVPQGWLKKHEFNESDLRAAAELLDQVFRDIDDSSNRWEFVNGLLLNVIYGGRVDNNFDLRILRSYLTQYFSDDTLGKQQSAIDNEIAIPLSKNLRDYISVVRRLPETDKSSYFGLPPNIDATVQYNQSLYLSSRLKAFYQTSIQSSAGDTSALMNKLAPVFSVWKALLQGTSFLANKDSITLSSLKAQSNPLVAFVVAESALAMNLVHIIHQSLATMNRSLKSGLVLSVSLMESAIEITLMKTPKSWYTLWEGPLQVEQYLRSLVKRARALTEEWLPSAQKNQLLSNVLDLSQLMNPEAFFSVHRQHSARELGISMDSLFLSTSWNRPSTNPSRTSAEVTATLSGIYIQGARMTSGIGMEECNVETPSWNPIPPCFLTWAPAGSSRVNGLHSVKVPLYVDEERQRLITVLDIPFGAGIIDDWYRAGIALSLKD